ncbi:hypothetical protein [Nonomuraea sp. JJY05]
MEAPLGTLRERLEAVHTSAVQTQLEQAETRAQTAIDEAEQL